jgi:hypothetical protein
VCIYKFDGGKRPHAWKHTKEFLMRKNKWFLAGMLAIALVFGLILAGCQQDPEDDGGSVTLEVVNNYTSAVTKIELTTTSPPETVWKKEGTDLVPAGETKTFSLPARGGFMNFYFSDDNDPRGDLFYGGGNAGKTITATISTEGSGARVTVGDPH